MALWKILHDTNQLLDRLSVGDMKRFLADCETVELGSGQILAEPGVKLLHVYFPIDCIISLPVSLESKSQLDVSMVGNEGMLGVSLMLGAQEGSSQALVKGAGFALRMPAARFLSHLKRSPALEKLIKRYTNVLLRQLSQSAACAHHHEVEARLARCLLMTHDRTGGNQLSLTHELLSLMIGVGRPRITRAAQTMQKRGLIDYYRGNITVNDRPGLEVTSCGCYAADQEIYDQMLD